MKIELYAIKDVMLGFSNPFASANDQTAIRAFASSVRSPQPNLANEYPEHKQLWHIGTMEFESGELESDVRFLANAMTYVQYAQTPLEEMAQKSPTEKKEETEVNENVSD